MKRIQFSFSIFLFLLIFGCSNKQQEQKRPNILFAISDDQSFLHTSFAVAKFVNVLYCLNHLAGKSEIASIENEMRNALVSELEKSGDPRIVGPDKEVFDSYIRYSPTRDFPKT